MKKLFLLLLFPAVFMDVYSQTFIRGQVELTHIFTSKERQLSSYTIGTFGFAFDHKIGLDKSFSSGIMYKSLWFGTKAGWTSLSDFPTYIQDYTNEGIPLEDIDDPEIRFRYIQVPVGFTFHTLFFSFKYQTGFNFLLHQPYFSVWGEDGAKANFQYNGARWLVLDQTFTLAFSAFGMLDMYASCSIYVNSLLRELPYTYSVMDMINMNPVALNGGMIFPIIKIKRKKI